MANFEYLNSVNIEVYPSAYRSLSYEKSKLNSEENITWLNRLSSYEKNNHNLYVDPLNTEYYILCLNGYKFRFKKDYLPKYTEEESSYYYKYAFICVAKEDTDNSTGEVLAKITGSDEGYFSASIDNLDDEETPNAFKGLCFSNTEPTSTTEYTFIVYQLTDEDNNLILQELKLSTYEIRASESDISIEEEFNTNKAFINDVLYIETENKSKNTTDTYVTEDGAIIGVPTEIYKTLLVKGDTTLNSDLKVNGNTEIDKDLLVTGTARLIEDIEIGKNAGNKTTKIKLYNKTTTSDIFSSIESSETSNNQNFKLPVLSNSNKEGTFSIINESQIITADKTFKADIYLGEEKTYFIKSDGSIKLKNIYLNENDEDINIENNLIIGKNLSVAKNIETTTLNDVKINNTTDGFKITNDKQTLTVKADVNLGNTITTTAPVKVSGEVNITSPTTINETLTTKSAVTVNQNSTVSISSPVIISGSTTVNKSTILGLNNDEVMLKTNQLAVKTTDTTSDVNLYLKAGRRDLGINYTGSNKAVCYQYKDGTQVKETWKDFTDEDTSDTIVYRDSSGVSKVKDFYITNQKGTQRALTIDSTGKVISKSLSTSNPSVSSGNTNQFISDISQDAMGKITATKKELLVATSSSVGGIKIGYSTSSTDRKYAVLLSNSQAYVNVPWVNTTYTAGTNLQLSGTTFSTKSTVSFTTVNATTFNATSDRRLKENIKDFNYDKSILDLEVKEFDYKKTGEHSIGCIAQDLQKLYPDLVIENEEGYLSIKESKLVYLLLKEVQKLNERVKELERK